MFLSRMLSNRQMAGLCRRLATATESGLDIRRTMEREADKAPAGMKGVFAGIRDGVAAGDNLHESMQPYGKHFPRLFVDLVGVGEASGSLAGVLKRLADHFEFKLRLRRIFAAAIIWPAIQLTAAIAIIGFLIWIMGKIGPGLNGKPTDPLGMGLVGNSGLTVYLFTVAVVGVSLFLVARAVQRGVFWTRGLQRFAIRTPAIGGALRTIAEAQVAWMLHLLLNVELDIRQVIPMALKSTGNDFYIRHTDQIVADVSGGGSLYLAFAHSGAFREEFLRQLEVGEESGRLVESLGPLADRYEQQARLAFHIFAVAAGFLVWGLVAMLIIFLIFRLAFFYFGTINDLASPP